MVEACHGDRLPLPGIFDPGHDMGPLKSTGFLRSHAGQEAEGHIRVQPVVAGLGQDGDGLVERQGLARPSLTASRVVTSSATLRATMSRAWACRTAR